MELAKLFVAVGISFMLFLFINSSVSAVYRSPKLNYTECYPDLTNSACENTIDRKCGTTNWTCSIEARGLQEYQQCLDNENSGKARCLERQTSKIVNYMTIYYLILAFLGIVFIIFGFLIITKESVASGFIGGGVLNLLLAYVFASMSSLTSSLIGSMSSLTEAAVSNASKTPTISYLNILFSFIGLLVLILFALFKLERNDQDGKENLYKQEQSPSQRPSINSAVRTAGLYQTRPMPV